MDIYNEVLHHIVYALPILAVGIYMGWTLRRKMLGEQR
jgi:hypothetical protein